MLERKGQASRGGGGEEGWGAGSNHMGASHQQGPSGSGKGCEEKTRGMEAE